MKNVEEYLYPSKILYVIPDIYFNLNKKLIDIKASELIKDNNYTQLYLSYICKESGLNLDLSRKFITEINHHSLWFNNKEVELYLELIKKLKLIYKDSRIFTLLKNSIEDEDTTRLEHFISTLNIDILKKIKKPKVLSELQRKYRLLVSVENSKLKDKNLSQKINIFEGKKVKDFTIKVPQKLEDLGEASRVLKICVGQGDHYADKTLTFKSQILFLTKNDTIEYCIELDPSRFFKIIQAEGLFGKKLDKETVEELQKLIDTRMGKYLL